MGYECTQCSHFLIAENHLLPTEVRKEALQLQKLLEYDDEGAEGKSCLIQLSAAPINADLH